MSGPLTQEQRNTLLRHLRALHKYVRIRKDGTVEVQETPTHPWRPLIQETTNMIEQVNQ